jgi:hypothetical protein
VPLSVNVQEGGCANCKVIGQRLDIRGRHSSVELKEMFFEGKVFQHLFIREVLMASPEGGKVILTESLTQICR